jgi:polyisoprenoid-binding protein YceI
MIRKILPLLFFISIDCFSQQYIAKDGEITFFSYAPIEDIKAVNKKVSAAFDVSNNDIVFQLYISDFNFRKKLMQTHFNENYLESDVFPKANFIGKVFALEEDSAIVRGLLTIHGISKEIEANGMFIQNNNTIKISSEFKIKLEDYNVSIPTIVMYKIAEEILVNVVIKLNSKR